MSMNPTTPERQSAPPGPSPLEGRRTRSRTRAAVLALVFAAGVTSAGLAATAGVVQHVDAEHRHGGYLTTDTAQVRSEGHAVVFEDVDLGGLSGAWLLGTVRLRSIGTDPGSPAFIGVGTPADVREYLRGTGYSTVTDIEDGEVTYTQHAGASPALAPGGSDIWTAQAEGTGPQTVTWKPEGGPWSVVVMNQDASSGIEVDVAVGATVPIVRRIVGVLLIGSVLSAAVALAILLVPAALGRRRLVWR